MKEIELRHREIFYSCLKHFFIMFLPDLVSNLRFESALLLEKEIENKFTDQPPNGDALVSIEQKLNEVWEEIIIYWVHWSSKPSNLEKQMYNYFYQLSVAYELLIFPMALYSGPEEPDSPEWEQLSTSVGNYEILSFKFPVFRLNRFTATEFMDRQPKNPLTWTYLPFTRYSEEMRPMIFALALQGIGKHVDYKNREKIRTLVSLVQLAMPMNPEEIERLKEIFEKPEFKEAGMLHSLREDGIIQGKKEAAIEHAKALLGDNIEWQVITKATGVTPEMLEEHSK